MSTKINNISILSQNKSIEDIINTLEVLNNKIDEYKNDNIEFIKVNKFFYYPLDFKNIYNHFLKRKEYNINNFKEITEKIIQSIEIVNKLNNYETDVENCKNKIKDALNNENSANVNKIINEINDEYNNIVEYFKNYSFSYNEHLNNLIEHIKIYAEYCEKYYVNKKFYNIDRINSYNKNIQEFYKFLINNNNKYDIKCDYTLIFALDHINSFIDIYEKFKLIENNKFEIEFKLRISKEIVINNMFVWSDTCNITLFDLDKNWNNYIENKTVNETNIDKINSLVNKINKIFNYEFKYYSSENIYFDKNLKKIYDQKDDEEELLKHTLESRYNSHQSSSNTYFTMIPPSLIYNKFD